MMASVPPADSDLDVAQLPDDVPADGNASPDSPAADVAAGAASPDAAEAAGGNDMPPPPAQFPPPYPVPAPKAAPRVNDAMRVLSRMQSDLDVLTGGKRAATYPEVDDAFNDAIRTLGIKLPPASAADPWGAEVTVAGPLPAATAPEGEPYEQDAMEEEQPGSALDASVSARPVQTGANPAPTPQPAGPTQTITPGTPASRSATDPADNSPPASPHETKVDLWRGGTIIKSQAGLPVSITGLSLTQGDYLLAVQQGLWSRVQGDDNTPTGFKDDKAVAAASAVVQKRASVSTVDVSSGDEVRRFIKEIAKATATATLGGKRSRNDDFERFITIGRNSAHQLIITSIHVVGAQGAHVRSMMPPGSITIAHYHDPGLVQPPNSADNSAVRLANISSFVIGNGGDTVWEVGRARGREVYREIGRGGKPGRWQRYLP